ncbi:hypothetical protein [Flavobacterium saccharophilum]|uniref:hypothetical protein n=1 Tax=Flavobacterium saccharophilum TaxID=29534 RepID=UPI000A320591|nr:hypothetical protein [Flavobacterium saccharophilum]
MEIRESNRSNQLLTIENKATHDVFVFAANNENLSILQYSSSLFLKDKYTTPLKNINNKSLIGYSFSEDGNPTLYWSTPDFEIILAVKCFLESKTSRILYFKFASSRQYVVSQFQQNDSFNILTKDLDDHTLMLYSFKNGAVDEKLLDFSTYRFQDKNGKLRTFTEIIRENPIEKMDETEYNPLYTSTAKTKLYVLPNRMIFTLDYNPKSTQIFDFNTETEEIKEKNFMQSLSEKGRKLSNSFFQNDKLYQVTANEEELSFDIKDYNTGQNLHSIKVSKNDTIKFKISPLFIQREGRKPTELKTTKKFLKHLSYLDLGLSVFNNNENSYFTIGGTPRIHEMNAFSNFEYLDPDLAAMLPGAYNSIGIVHTESVYFESVFDSNYTFLKQENIEPLAMDNIYYFLNTNKKIALNNIIKYKDFYILGYYDSASKQYIMRKFKDGFNADDPFLNEIKTPSSFKRPFLKTP